MSSIAVGKIIEQRIKTVDPKYDGKISYIDISSIDSKRKKITSAAAFDYSSAPSRAKQLIQNGDILVSTVRPNLNAVALVDSVFDNLPVASTGYSVLRVREGYSNRYLFHYCQSSFFIRCLVSHATGASYPAVNNRIIRNCLIPNHSLAEQERIADLFDSINALIIGFEKKEELLDNLVKSRFVEMFGDAADGEYCPLKDCCDSIVGGMTPSMKHDEFYGGNVPFIKSGDVKSTSVSSGALWLTETALDKTTARYVPAGSIIVVTRSGILKHTLPVAVAANPVVINQDLKAFIPKSTFHSQYLAWAIRSQAMSLLSRARATSVDNIESKELFSIPIFQASESMQTQFAAFVAQVDKSQFAVQRSIEQLELLKAKLMQEYFG